MHSTDLEIRLAASHDLPSDELFRHSAAQRVNTEAVILQAIRTQYPQKHITITPEYGCNLLAYASAGHALASPLTSPEESLPWKSRSYAPPARKIDGGMGGLVDRVLLGKYQYAWNDNEFILYLVEGLDGFYPVRNNYLIGDETAVSQLIFEVGNFTAKLHNEIWVFDQVADQDLARRTRREKKAALHPVSDALRDYQRATNDIAAFEKLDEPLKVRALQNP